MQSARGIGSTTTVCLLLVLVFGSVSQGDYPNRVLDDEPLGYWRLNESSGSVAVNLGTAGPSLDGTFVGGGLKAPGPTELADGTPIFGLGLSNVAFEVGGPSSYLNVDGSPLSGLTEFTLTSWFTTRLLEENQIGLLGQSGAIELGFTEPDQLALRTAGGGSLTWQFDLGNDIATDNWYYVAAVGTGESLQLYLNGQLVQSGGTPITADYGASAAPFRVGGGGIFGAANSQLIGTVDEIAIWGSALSGAQIAEHFAAALGGGIPGDFDSNGFIEVADVNSLERAIYEGSDDLLYDVDGNLTIDDDDLAFWVGDIAFTWFGDANLDQEFSSSDFVAILANGEYEDNIPENSTWDEGDWNADLDFSSDDLVTALAFGGYEIGPPQALPIPELAGERLWLLGLSAMIGRMAGSRCRRRLIDRAGWPL
jgi:hypothetical protein